MKPFASLLIVAAQAVLCDNNGCNTDVITNQNVDLGQTVDIPLNTGTWPTPKLANEDYTIIQTRLNWPNAKLACENLNLELVSEIY